MTARRTFTADELARLFKGQANEGNGYSVDLGGGLKAVQMAKGDGLLFQIQRDGKAEYFLRDADAVGLEEISAIIRAKYAPLLPDDPDPDKARQGWEEKDPRFSCKDTPCGRLCMRKDLDPALADDLEARLAPDALVVKKGPDKPTLDELLTPGELRDPAPDPLAGTIEGLTPDALRPKPDENPLGYPGDK